MAISQKTIGDGIGGAFSANFRTSAGGNFGPAPAASGMGALTAVPAGSANGTALGAMPEGGVGARLYLGQADSVTFTIASAQPGAPPTATFTVSGAGGGTGANWDESLCDGAMIYVTALTGAPKYRFI